MNDADIIRRLLAETSPVFRRAYLQLVGELLRAGHRAALAGMIESGNLGPLLRVLDNGASVLAGDVSTAFATAGRAIGLQIGKFSGVPAAFDATAVRAVSQMREMGLRLVREVTDEQRLVFRTVMTDGAARGLTTKQIAREVRESLGLTLRQEQAVANYRRLLGEGNADALARQLRDRRFDGRVESALSGKRPLTEEEIDRMVGRYRERMLIYRSETIAITESRRAVHAGAREMYAQAVERGDLQPQQIVHTWRCRFNNTRDWHASMNGDNRPFNQPFQSGLGNRLMFPGDPSAPGADTIRCQCVLVTRLIAAPPQGSVLSSTGTVFL